MPEQEFDECQKSIQQLVKRIRLVDRMQEFVPQPNQAEFFKFIENAKTVDATLLGKTRQTGRSTATLVAALWYAAFNGKNIVFVSPNHAMAKRMMDGLLKMAAYLPEAIKQFSIMSGRFYVQFNTIGYLTGSVTFKTNSDDLQGTRCDFVIFD